MDDRALIEEYASMRSNAAFEEIVRRYWPLVYSSAVRRVGRSDAEDVAQAAFLVLHRRIDRLRRKGTTNLAGWLFAATRYAALESIRARRRREERERNAAEYAATEIGADEDRGNWARIRPALDAALDRLGGADREAVLLRFFQHESYAEVGRVLGVSENTAAKRVGRALGRLRRHIGRGGVMPAAALLPGLLSEHTCEALPAGASAEAATVIAGVIGSGSGATAASALAAGAIDAIMAAQVKTVAAVCCAVVAVAGSGAGLTARYLARCETANRPFALRKIERAQLCFRGKARLPDDSMGFQINLGTEGNTRFVRLRDTLCGYNVAEYVEKTRLDSLEGVGRPVARDVSDLILDSDAGRLVLTRNQWVRCNAFAAYMLASSSGTEYVAVEGDTVTDGTARYRVSAIDPAERSVRLTGMTDGSEITIRAGRSERAGKLGRKPTGG